MRHHGIGPEPEPGAGEPAAPAAEGVRLTQLLKLCARGDRSAFTELYHATSARVYGLAVRVVRDRAQAEEVVQEVYLDVWRTAARYDPERGGAMSWILTLCHRRSVDRVRSAAASARREDAYGIEEHDVAHDSTAETVQDSFEARRVREALDGLTDVQREALELAFFGGYTHTEVATMLELPVGTAKTRIRDGLIRLRDRLGVTA